MALSLPALDSIERDLLVDRSGVTFKEFRRTLKPNYLRVWLEIGAGWGVIALIVFGIVRLDQAAPRAFPLIALVGGFGIGYVMQYIELFFHEAAHFNLAPSRKLNDVLANATMGWVIGHGIGAYRVVHMDHHRMLGSPTDTEHSYFEPLNVRFLVEGLTGIKMLRVLIARGSHVRAKKQAATPAKSGLLMLLLGFALNVGIVGVSAWARCWSLFFAWPLGIILFLPATIALRQLLEHRSFDAKADVDYAVEQHGANTRMFGSGPLASTLGGAGFNRHLLHHWEPQLSYTNLKQVELFLLDTEAAGPVLRQATTTYFEALRRLMNQR